MPFLILSLALLLATGCSNASPLAGAAADPPAGVTELTMLSHGQRLAGHIYTTAGPGPHPTVVLLHGLPGNERNLDLAQHLRRNGWHVVFFHYRGAWGSEGQYRFAHLAEDARAVLDHLQAHATSLRVDRNRLALVGHSAGGFAAIHGARDPRVACVVGLAPADLGRYPALGQLERVAAYMDTLFMLRGASAGQARQELLAHGEAWALTPVLATLAKPALVVTAELDPVITPELPQVAGVQGIELAGADHSFNSHRLQLADLVQAFLDACPATNGS